MMVFPEILEVESNQGVKGVARITFRVKGRLSPLQMLAHGACADTDVEMESFLWTFTRARLLYRDAEPGAPWKIATIYGSDAGKVIDASYIEGVAQDRPCYIDWNAFADGYTGGAKTFMRVELFS